MRAPTVIDPAGVNSDYAANLKRRPRQAEVIPKIGRDRFAGVIGFPAAPRRCSSLRAKGPKDKVEALEMHLVSQSPCWRTVGITAVRRESCGARASGSPTSTDATGRASRRVN